MTQALDLKDPLDPDLVISTTRTGQQRIFTSQGSLALSSRLLKPRLKQLKVQVHPMRQSSSLSSLNASVYANQCCPTATKLRVMQMRPCPTL